MLVPILAFMMMHPSCPLTIGVGKDGTIFFDRFSGWYKTTPKTLESVIHAGCYNDGDPNPLTSIRLVLASDAPKQRVDLVNSILKQEGWNSEKVTVQPWVTYPKKPR